ncbi:Helix-turn-helix domain-containing protein [Halogranum amylolyticum]|uniref:Helix-turn-helix domain-containing protein n=1 Tax=Halogranum amylolyticum TaxID=660520 RepID=A0A1H8TIQ7_9EURY|nr:winged helix-turn-helix domain-containing protein [Halogranum amylolyticum]SEO90757.1 Helix-turn-helix domain-containing protein [Halogranum amylolyticum]
MSLFDVLGSKPRLRIIQELSSEPRYVTELAETVGMDGKSAVHHLDVLEESGIVESYRTSRRKYYRLRRTVELRASPPPERSFCLHTGDTDRAVDEDVFAD